MEEIERLLLDKEELLLKEKHELEEEMTRKENELQEWQREFQEKELEFQSKEEYIRTECSKQIHSTRSELERQNLHNMEELRWELNDQYEREIAALNDSHHKQVQLGCP